MISGEAINLLLFTASFFFILHYFKRINLINGNNVGALAQ